MDKDEFNNNETLVLRKVGKNMAGDFRCRAVNDFGAEFSESAVLTVLGNCLYLLLNCCYQPFSHLLTLNFQENPVNVLNIGRYLSTFAVKVV